VGKRRKGGVTTGTSLNGKGVRDDFCAETISLVYNIGQKGLQEEDEDASGVSQFRISRAKWKRGDIKPGEHQSSRKRAFGFPIRKAKGGIVGMEGERDYSE